MSLDDQSLNRRLIEARSAEADTRAVILVNIVHSVSTEVLRWAIWGDEPTVPAAVRSETFKRTKEDLEKAHAALLIAMERLECIYHSHEEGRHK